MKRFLFFSCFFAFCFASAQQNVVVISKCGGVDTVTISTIIDNDLDGMDDTLEQRLLNHFMPIIIQFDNESCTGPALDGTGDSNLVVCHIYPLPEQYAFSNSLDSVVAHPVALVPKKGLVTGLIWYDPLIKVNTAILYGKDCGLAGHTADVEGFNYSIKYIGPDTAAGWMYDTVMQHWMGGTIQTISHEGTLCEQIETHPYKSALFPYGLDTVYVSPDKHGNYLTISGCGSSFICNPGCGGIPSTKNVRAINLGEPNAPLVTDLGSEYPAYAGNNPWSSSNFLSANGGNAGAIPTKMILKLTSDFIQGTTITSQAQICNIYSRCFIAGSSFADYTCNGSPYNFYNQQLTASGTYYHTLTSSYGCDSTVALSLTVLPLSASSVSASSCNSYNFNGQALTASGTYQDTLSNLNGCDSIVTLALSIHSPSSHSFTAVVCSGSSFEFNGQALNVSGIYADTLSTIYGCDSMVYVSLTVDTLPQVSLVLGADTLAADAHAVLLNGGNPTGGAYYGTGVSGNLFFPVTAGEGNHLISYVYTDALGCSDTATAIFVVVATGINNIEEEGAVSIYPNPAADKIQIACPKLTGLFTSSIYNMDGALVSKVEQQRNMITMDVSGLAAGVYTVQVCSAGFVATSKLIIQ